LPLVELSTPRNIRHGSPEWHCCTWTIKCPCFTHLLDDRLQIC
jgi:hypothetical protein